MKRKPRHEENGFERWGGYMNAKITKLEEQFEEESKEFKQSGKLSDLFQGIAIFVNGYTEPSSEDLRLLMLLHGGTYHHYYRSGKTTHMIASNLPNAKIMQLKTIKVVKPEWIVKSIEARKLLDYKKFLLFNSQPSLLSKFMFYKNTGDEGNEENILDPHPSKQNQNVAKTAVDPHFLKEFYSNSRLHHISTLGAMFKQYVGELREKHSGIFPGQKRISDTYGGETLTQTKIEFMDRVVMHIDMDCFFVSVALRNRPELVGKPVAVTHARGNPAHLRSGVNRKFEYEFYKKKMEAKVGLKNNVTSDSDESNDEENKQWFEEPNSMSEVASCSYEARKAGVCNGMYLGSALKLCPGLITVPYDFEGYQEVSYILYNTVAEYTLDIEAVSCDELYIDCTSLIRNLRIRPLDFATILRKDILERTQCSSSVGIGANKLQARLATKRAKPNGQFYIMSGELMDFMREIDIYDLPGVGRTLGYKLKNLGVKTCQDLQNVSSSTLRKEFGIKTGETLFKHCRGIDDRTVNSTHQRKSVSAEVNYGIRFNNDEEAVTFLKQLSLEVATRLKDVNMKGRNITFKVMVRAKDAPKETAKFLGHGACDYTTRSSSLPFPSDDCNLIFKHVINLYHQLSVPASELRGIGIQITKLESCKKSVGTLQNFFKADTGLKKREEIQRKTTEIKNKLPQNKSLCQRIPGGIEKLDLPPLSQLDRSSFESLPKELKLEILNEYQVDSIWELEKIRPRDPDTSVVLSPATLDALPKYFRNEILSSRVPKHSEFTPLPFGKMKAMIREWVTSEEEPLEFDVSMLADYVSELVGKKKLEELSILVKCFHRHICTKRSGNQNWSNAYRNITGRLQFHMKKVYGKELFIQEI